MMNPREAIEDDKKGYNFLLGLLSKALILSIISSFFLLNY